MQTKICKKCNTEKPITSFYKGEGKLGKRNYCCECSSKYNKKWRKENPEKYKKIIKNCTYNYYKSGKGWDVYYKRMYGISKKEYDLMLYLQNNKCKICGKPNKNNRNLSVDHNHKTRKVRGLLCSKCNSILGLCNESMEILLNVISYIKDSNVYIDSINK